MKRILIIIGAVIILLGVLSIRHYSSVDGFPAVILALAFPEDTVYAPGYTDAGFMKVEVGMTREQVYRLIGQPISVWTNSDTIGERWSRSPGDTHFRCRVLQFSEGKVVDKHSEYYID
jgi:hypothetical protein